MKHQNTKNGCNRRKFLAGSLAGIGSLGAIGALHQEAAADTQTSEADRPEGELLYRALGRTGLKLPIVSMGVMNASNPEVVEESYKLGVRMFDTAWYYQRGRNEKMLGDVISKLGVRDEVVIATKVLLDMSRMDAERGKAKFLQQFDQSLQRLQTDYVDILYLHDVDNVAQIANPGLYEAFTQLKDEGKIKFCGVSTHSNTLAILGEMLKKTDFWDVALVAYNLAMADDEQLLAAYKQAADAGLGLVVMKTQAGANWWRAQYQSNQAMRGQLNHAAMLKWTLKHPFFATAIPGYTTFEHMQEDFSVAYSLDYSPEEQQFLNDKAVASALGFCRQCSRCVPSCPQGVDVPTLMRTAMYAYQYQNMEHAYATYQTVAANQNLSQCQSCAICTAICANSVPIAQKIGALQELNLA